MAEEVRSEGAGGPDRAGGRQGGGRAHGVLRRAPRPGCAPGAAMRSCLRPRDEASRRDPGSSGGLPAASARRPGELLAAG